MTEETEIEDLETEVPLFDEQMVALRECLDFVTNNTSGTKRFRARAGVGKTLVTSELIKIAAREPYYLTAGVVCFTGRAASQLTERGIDAYTIHSVFYAPILDEHGDILRWVKKSVEEIRSSFDFLAVDEGSMIPRGIYEDLVDVGIPILFVGDDKQVPPISPDGDTFNLMEEDDSFFDSPESTLLVNRRTDEESKGIYYLADHLTREDSIPRIKMPALSYSKKSMVKKVKFHQDNDFSIILCGMNKTRKIINSIVREAKGYEGEIPQEGEKVICLKNSVFGGFNVMNGEIFTVEGNFPLDENSKTYILRKDTDDSIVYVPIGDETFISEKPYINKNDPEKKFGCFTFGYCISVHKAQGSTFENVLFYDEDVSFFLDRQKFRYTACTRPSKSLTVAL